MKGLPRRHHTVAAAHKVKLTLLVLASSTNLRSIIKDYGIELVLDDAEDNLAAERTDGEEEHK